MSKLHNYVQDYVTKASKDINGVVNSEKANKLKKKLLLISGIGSAITVLLFGIGSLMMIDVIRASLVTQLIIMILAMFGILIFVNMFVMTIKVTIATGAISFITPKCPKCKDTIADGEMFCSKCGYKLFEEVKMKSCSKCGADNDSSDAFCMKCGEKLDSEVDA